MPLAIHAIVCAVDFSSFSPLVVSVGAALAKRAAAPLYLIHAVHEPRDGVHSTTVFERGGDLADRTEQARRQMEALMAAHGPLAWEAVVRFGDPVEQMAAVVRDLPASLVVSASHGVSGFRRLFVGTVVERLTRQLDGPMLVVKPGAADTKGRFDGFRNAVVSCDRRGNWRQMAPLLRLLQPAAGAQVHLVHALEGPADAMPTDDDTASYGQVQQVQSQRLKRQLGEQARNLFSYAEGVFVATQPGVPREMVLRTAGERAADIIAVGVRRSGKVRRWLSGSTTEALLRHAACCVLTVPESAFRKAPAKPLSPPATGVVWDPVYLKHVTDEGHPEHPRRLKPLYERLQETAAKGDFATLSPPPATEDEILGVHRRNYLQQVKATAGQNAAVLSADTLTCGRSWHTARLAAGGTVEAVRQVVDGRLSNALVLARPPGHHAEHTRAMGFCIFNNVAIGAIAARKQMGLDRIMIVDWDLHHGNGTQHIFERDASVFFFSSHQFPHYPGTGHLSETGLGAGEGRTMNVPLRKGCGDGDFVALYQRLLTPVAHAFKPQLILVSAGFDIHIDDPLGGMRVTPAGFAGLTRVILDIARAVCSGRAVFCLEGGYDGEALADSVLAVIDELTGRTSTDVNAMAAGADAGRVNAILEGCLHTHGRFWKELANE
jgi:acetoin utilization deacetylase AcuC-like enzyme/nucleotide-binding universal stress UspA family protein